MSTEEIGGTGGPRGKCRNCGIRDAKTYWVGEGGALAWSHGMGSPWCMVCCYKEQLKYARRSVAEIPKIEAKLEKALVEAPVEKEITCVACGSLNVETEFVTEGVSHGEGDRASVLSVSFPRRKCLACGHAFEDAVAESARAGAIRFHEEWERQQESFQKKSRNSR